MLDWQQCDARQNFRCLVINSGRRAMHSKESKSLCSTLNSGHAEHALIKHFLLLNVLRAVQKWLSQTAAVLGISNEQLPQDDPALIRMLHQAAADYSSALLSAPSTSFTPKHLKEPLEWAASFGFAAAVGHVLAAASPSMPWSLAQLDDAIYYAASEGKWEVFKQLVGAGLDAANHSTEQAAAGANGGAAGHGDGAVGGAGGAEGEAGAAVGEGLGAPAGDGGAQAAAAQEAAMYMLEYALCEATSNNSTEVVAWVLQKGQGAWGLHHVLPSINAAAEGGYVKPVKLLLNQPGVALTAAALGQALLAAAKSSKPTKQLFQLLLGALLPPPPSQGGAVAAAAAGPEDQVWKSVHLAKPLAALVQGAPFGTKVRKGLIQQLLLYPGVVWNSTDLRPAVKKLCSSSFAFDFSSGPKLLRQLLAAASDQWTASQLSKPLKRLAVCPGRADGKREVLQLLLEYPGVVWESEDLLPALLETSKQKVKSAPGEVKGLLAAAKDQWSGGQLAGAVVKAAVADAAPGVKGEMLQVLLKQPGVVWSRRHLLPALRKLLSEGSEVDLVWSEVLLEAAAKTWTGEQLEELVKPLVERKVNQKLQGKLLLMLLQWPGVDWDISDLQSILDQLLSQGPAFPKRAELVQATLAAATDPWSGLDLGGPLSAAVAQQDAALVSLLLELPGVHWTAGELMPAICAAMVVSAEQPQYATTQIQQLLAVPWAGWTRSHLEVLSMHAVARQYWTPLQLLLDLPALQLTEDQLHLLLGKAVAGNAAAVAGVVGSHLKQLGSKLQLREEQKLLGEAAGLTPQLTQLMKRLLGSPGVSWPAASLAAPLLLISAAGDSAFAGEVIKLGGSGWVPAHLYKAVEAAARRSCSKLVDQLLAASASGWPEVGLQIVMGNLQRKGCDAAAAMVEKRAKKLAKPCLQ